jgi:hypothetical protein
VADGLFDRLAGDLVEHHAAGRHFGLELLLEVPGDGLSLAVFVGGEVQLGRVLERRLERGDDVALGDLVGELEVVLDVDAQAARGQVHHVAHRGHHRVVLPEELTDGLRLRWRLDHDERLRCHGRSGSVRSDGASRKVLLTR